jgi:1,4-alpha-glucan branching enzyme
VLDDDALHYFAEGKNTHLADALGAKLDGDGATVAVWAPNAARVSIIGDFNGWNAARNPLERGASGIWTGRAPGARAGSRYKLRIVGPDGATFDRGDPFATRTEHPPERASVLWDLDHEWTDSAWMKDRAKRTALGAPISIYEVHLGSWMRGPGHRHLTYREIAPKLADYALAMGFTHVELMPLMEHPFYGSWGYQVTSYFAPTARYGAPQDLMFLIDTLHQAGIGVILDWVPSHFPSDEHGLGYFDGTHLFEHADTRRGYHPDWKSFIFDYGRGEVRSFLLSSARFWLERYHADALRVDAVASMLYLDYSRPHGEWIPNEFGGRENLDAIRFLRDLNETVYGALPDVQTIAEESTAWPMVSRPLYVGGLGFGFKWDMGWMNDTLRYLKNDPIYRSFSHNELTFRQVYANTENFVLALSHDEVVHGKGSLLGKMPGDDWQKRANLRLLFAWQWAQPGKKLSFMGGELGTMREWDHDGVLDWSLLDDPRHAGIQRVVGDLNRLYVDEPAMHVGDCRPDGFSWVDCHDATNSVVSFLRSGAPGTPQVLVCFNFTPVPRRQYRIGVPYGGRWREVLCTDAAVYGGSGMGNLGGADADAIAHHERDFSLLLTLPPLSAVFLVGETPPPPAPPPRVAAPPIERRSGPWAPAPTEDAPTVPAKATDEPSLRLRPRAFLPAAAREPLARVDRSRAVGRAVPRLERAHHGRVLPAERDGADPRRDRRRRPRRLELRAHQLQLRADAAVVARGARPAHLRRGDRGRR